MNKKRTNKYFLSFSLLVVASLLLAACGKNAEQPDYVTVLSVQPTDDISVLYTAAAETIFVEMTQTELAKPTETPVPPTETPVPTETFTATSVPTSTTAYVYVPVVYPTSTPGTVTATSTATNATAVNYACSITSKNIADNTEFAPNEEFDATWTIKNTGSLDWEADQIDYRYVSGTQTYKFNSVYDFPASVKTGDSITIIVDMVAPSSEASYETFWGVFYSSTNFCTLPMRIKVVD